MTLLVALLAVDCSDVLAVVALSSLRRKNGGVKHVKMNKRERRAQAKGKTVTPQINTGMFGNIPPELFLQIFKFLSSEANLMRARLPLHECNCPCRDALALLYCMRWGLASNAKLRECAWRNIYIQNLAIKMVLSCPLNSAKW